MTAIDHGTRNTTLLKGEAGLLNELDSLKKEKLLLEKQNKVIKKQALELRENFQELQERCIALESTSNKPTEKYREHYTIPAFIDDANGPSLLLKNAVKYCETHDGCPFLSVGCDHASHTDCNGIWVQMGVPCEMFAGKIKVCMKSMNGLRK